MRRYSSITISKCIRNLEVIFPSLGFLWKAQFHMKKCYTARYSKKNLTQLSPTYRISQYLLSIVIFFTAFTCTQRWSNNCSVTFLQANPQVISLEHSNDTLFNFVYLSLIHHFKKWTLVKAYPSIVFIIL